jgi:hypothetical protein
MMIVMMVSFAPPIVVTTAPAKMSTTHYHVTMVFTVMEPTPAPMVLVRLIMVIPARVMRPVTKPTILAIRTVFAPITSTATTVMFVLPIPVTAALVHMPTTQTPVTTDCSAMVPIPVRKAAACIAVIPVPAMRAVMSRQILVSRWGLVVAVWAAAIVIMIFAMSTVLV